MKPRLWVASELYFPEETSTGYFLTMIAESLTDKFDVNIISGRPAYSERALPVLSIQKRNGTNIYRMASTRFNKDRIILRVLNLLTFSVSAFFFSLTRFSRNDIVLVVTNPPTLPAVILLASKLRGCRTCLLVHDVYPNVLAAAGAMDPKGFAYRALDRFFSYIFHAFDNLIVLGRDMAALVGGKLRSRLDSISIIPNWGDVEEIAPKSTDKNNILRKDLGLEDAFVVQFSGNIGRTHDLESILACASAVSDDERIQFLLVGYGGRLAHVRSRIEHLNLPNVKLLPRQPRDKLPEMLRCSDITVISFVDNMYGLSVPSRMYNVMAAGVPIAAMSHSHSELSLVVQESGGGWTFSERDVLGLATLVRELVEDRTVASMRGACARDYVVHNFTLTIASELYLKLLTDLATHR